MNHRSPKCYISKDLFLTVFHNFRLDFFVPSFVKFSLQVKRVIESKYCTKIDTQERKQLLTVH